MGRKSSVTDEQIVQALFACGSVTDAAQSLGMSRRALQRRKLRKEFQELYNEARGAVVKKAVHALNARMLEAVEITAAIMRDEKVNAATRLQACQTILGNGFRALANGTEDAQETDSDIVIVLPAKKPKI